MCQPSVGSTALAHHCLQGHPGTRQPLENAELCEGGQA